MSRDLHRGKGAKDRILPLPESTLSVMRSYWKQHRHQMLLFPANALKRKSNKSATTPMAASSVQRCLKQAAKSIGIRKAVSPHTMRHSVATHLFEGGVSLRWIQKFLGHANLQTTLIYLHLTDDAQVDGRRQLNEIAATQTIDKLFSRFAE